MSRCLLFTWGQRSVSVADLRKGGGKRREGRVTHNWNKFGPKAKEVLSFTQENRGRKAASMRLAPRRGGGERKREVRKTLRDSTLVALH